MKGRAAPRPDDERVHLLTVLHSAELTGPPILAVQFLRWLHRERPQWAMSTLLLDAGGPLEEELGRLGQVITAGRRLAPFGVGRSRARAALNARAHRRLGRMLEGLGPIDVVHLHCLSSFKVTPALPAAPVLAHVHELSVGQDLHLGSQARRHVHRAERYVAVSDRAKAELVDRFDVPPDRVDRQWGFVDRTRLPDRVERSDLDLPESAFVVVAAGVRHWRKAPELFVRIARRAAALRPDVEWRFVWVGGSGGDGLEELVDRAGLGDLVRFETHGPDALSWIVAADAFALTAREDAFPLVAVEAAATATPIVTFDNGGAADLVRESGGGVVVPPLDVESFASSLVELATDAGRRGHLGQRAAEHATRNLTVEHAGPRLLAVLDRTRLGTTERS